MSRPRKVAKPKDFSIRLEEKLVEQLDAIAMDQEFPPTRNELIRRILQIYVRDYAKPARKPKGE